MAQKSLFKIDPNSTEKVKSKQHAMQLTEDLNKKIYDLLYLMFAHDKYSLLVIMHGIDTSGKDGAVRHIFSAANPQGLTVHSFK